jgi:hypothetical protein
MAKEGQRKKLEQNAQLLKFYFQVACTSVVRTKEENACFCVLHRLCTGSESRSALHVPGDCCSRAISCGRTSNLVYEPCAAQVVHVIVRYIMRYQSTSGWSFVGSALLSGCLAVAYRYLQQAADPTYGPPPEFQLIDAGADLTKPNGAQSSAKDLLWSAVILLPLVAITQYAWIVAAVVPVYAGYMMYKKFAPMLGVGGQGQAQGTDANQTAKQERAAQRSQRRRMKRL